MLRLQPPSSVPRGSRSRLSRVAAALAAAAAITDRGARSEEAGALDEEGRPLPEEARSLAHGPPVDGADVALFLPRAILYVPSKVIGLIAFPIEEALRAVERNHVIEHLQDVFYNDDRTAAVLPLISASTFLGARFGVQAFHDDLGGHGEHAAIQASFGIDRQQKYKLEFRGTRVGGTRVWVESTTSFEEQPSLRYYGIGRADDPPIGFYAERRFRQLATVGATLGPEGVEVRVGGHARFKHSEFDAARGLSQDERPIEAVYDTSAIPGFGAGATVLELEAMGELDTRDAKGATSRGVFLSAFVGGALPIRTFQYLHLGLEATGYIPVYRDDRVLILRATFDGIEANDVKAPFDELPSLGGAHRLRGYPLHRFRDEKALTATVEYQYPIHQLVAGTLFVDVGEVSRGFTDLFTDPDLHVGGGGGLIVRSKSRKYLSVEIAGGDGVQVVLTTDPLSAFADRDDDL
ncbi:MAG: hypothetical protein U0414_05965 [Polyangiaceae bacterium]